MNILKFVFVSLCIVGGCPLILHAQPTGWEMHTIDNSSRGADGIRTADINGDGLFDLVSGWEEGGQIRVYLNPGPVNVKSAWPATTVGEVASPEDAVFADLDQDGHFDVISCCEGKTRSVFVHWSDGAEWTTAAFPQLKNKFQWMFATPMDIDQIHGTDLVIGAKGTNAQLGWLQSPSNSRRLTDWKWFPLTDVGWLMSIEIIDMDGDEDPDILYSDRKGNTRGVHWLEFVPSANLTARWKRHTVGGIDREVMFLSSGDLNHDGLDDVAVAVKDGPITWFRRRDAFGDKWDQFEIPMPVNTGTGKGVAIIDVDLNGENDVVFTCENSQRKIGVAWLSPKDEEFKDWTIHDISGTRQGIKFDLIQTLDLDADGDLDVLTCEERDNLGVIWYENPTR